MKVSHKLGKVFSREAHTRAWRRLDRKLHPIPLRPLLDKIDQERLRTIQMRYANSSVPAAKYAKVESKMKLNIERVQDLKLNRLPPKELLDLGCGGGFFLFICQQLGHRCLGLDIDEFPLFAELTDLFGIERRICRIKPFEPLPDLGRKFDWITAFAVAFNRKDDNKTLWEIAEWDFFLSDLANHLRPDGKVFLDLNAQYHGWYYSNELRDFFLSRGASVERERICFENLASNQTR